MNRLFGIILALVWIVAMAALVKRDMVPFWIAEDLPAGFAPDQDTQWGIFDADGRSIGTAWIAVRRTSGETTVESTTSLDFRGVPILLDSAFTSLGETGIQQFQFRLLGAPVPILVRGERIGRDFSCSAKIGTIVNTFSLDARLSQFLGESFRPFSHLRGLHVGQSWRIRLLDPLALIKDRTIDFKVQLARVTKREVIEHDGSDVECFRIESNGSVAWADDTGRILRQEVQVPLLGRCVLQNEPFDRATRAAARAVGTSRKQWPLTTTSTD